MSTIKHIRKHVFKATQAEFAALAGVAQATVCRWEKGVSPSLDEMQAIRNAAAQRPDIVWDDALFFTKPEEMA